MNTFNRKNLILWKQGVLLDRTGVDFVVCNTIEAQKAEELLSKGQTVYLTENDKIVSKMISEKGAFVEKAITEEDKKKVLEGFF